MDKESANSLKILFVIFIFFGIAYTIIDPLIPLISERLGIGYDRIGLVLFASASISLISTFLSGRFSDKYDIKKIIMTGIILTSAGFLIYGVFFSFLIFLLTVIFFRVGSGILDSSVHAYVSKRYPRRQSALFVKLDLFWYLGAITGPLAVSIFLYTGLNVSYVFLGFFAAIVIAFFLFIKFYAGLEEKIKSGKETGMHKNVKSPANVSDPEILSGMKAVESSGTYMTILKNPVILLSTGGLFFYIGIFSLLSTWLTSYFADFNIPVAFSSAVLAGFWAFNAVGVLITGWAIKRFNENKLIMFYSIVGIISTISYSIIPHVYVKIVFLILQAICYSSFFPLLNSIAVRQNEEFSGTVLGVTLSVSVIGLVFFQPVSGAIMEYFGKTGVNYLLIVTAVMFFLFILLLYIKLAKTDKV